MHQRFKSSMKAGFRGTRYRRSLGLREWIQAGKKAYSNLRDENVYPKKISHAFTAKRDNRNAYWEDCKSGRAENCLTNLLSKGAIRNRITGALRSALKASRKKYLEGAVSLRGEKAA